MTNYEDWVATKLHTSETAGIDVAEVDSRLHPHVQDVVRWALRRGRAAAFLDTGLAKSSLQAEIARHVTAHTGGRFLILTPLAVAEQMVRECAKFGVEAKYLREDDGVTPIVVTNYDLLHKFDASRFVGVSLDESSILKSYDGATRKVIIESFRDTPFRFACTATPAPNDHTELGNHSEFLGIKSRVEMLAEFFCHDGGDTSVWRLKGHAEEAFWRWVCTWGAMVKRPSDLGHDDSRFILPPLRMHEHVVPVEHSDAWAKGMLFAPQVTTLSDQRATRRMTMQKRAELAAKLADGADQCIIWGELNDECDLVAKLITDAVQVAGSDSPEVKAARLLGFADGAHRVIVTKPSVAGFGVNWQSCARMVFLGASHSFEQTYQAIRRCWRFGQTRPVDVHVIRAETEEAIVENFRRKEADAERMAAGTREFVLDAVREAIGGAKREWNNYDPRHVMTVPSWVGVEDSP